MNAAQKAAALKEILEGSETVYLTCAAHNYFPRSIGIERVALLPPMNECRHCAFAYLVTLFSMLPPHIRLERLEMLERGIHHTLEAAKRGEFIDFYDHPEIKIEHEQ